MVILKVVLLSEDCFGEFWALLAVEITKTHILSLDGSNFLY